MKVIVLTQGTEALVDDIDWIVFAQQYWCFNGNYACRSESRKHLYLHIEISKRMQIWYPGCKIDHHNQVKLDYQRHNLRIATRSDNGANRGVLNTTYGYKGVSYDKRSRQWSARIKSNSRYIYLGYFDCLHCAAEAYNIAAINIFKEFASLNIIGEHVH